MRHDSHFVEEITAAHSESIGRLVDIGRIEPNPHQPRKDFGDLTEMVASIKEKGILEPILVRNHDGNYQIIAGERRYQAACIAGLQRLPCIEVDVDTRGMLEISLIENLQRRDLTPFEEAAALQRLCDQFRYTHDEIARKLGKSRTVITESLSLNKMPEEIQERCRQADIVSKSMLLQIVRQDTAEDMLHLVDQIAAAGISREEARQFKREQRPPRKAQHFVFRYEPQDDEFSFRVTFRKQRVERDELIDTLERILASLRRTPDAEFSNKRTITAVADDEEEPAPAPAARRSRRPRPTTHDG
jgi:ParB family chromosome partitioning protein